MEVPLWTIVQPHHLEYSQSHEDSAISQDATVLKNVSPEHLGAQWYSLSVMRNGDLQLTDQQIQMALRLTILPSMDAGSGGFHSPKPAGVMESDGSKAFMDSSSTSPRRSVESTEGTRVYEPRLAWSGSGSGSLVTPEQAGESVTLNPIARQKAGGSAGLATSGSTDDATVVRTTVDGAGGTVAPQLQHRMRPSPVRSTIPAGSSLPVVEEGSGSVAYDDNQDGTSMYDAYGMNDDRDYLDGDENFGEIWEDVSDTCSVSSTGSNYSDGHVGEMHRSPDRWPAGAGSHLLSRHQQRLGAAAVLSGDSVPDMGAVTVPRPLTLDSLRDGNMILTITIVELCCFGGSKESGRNGGGLRKSLDAEWYVKLRLMKPQGRSFVQADKPYRTEFQRALTKSQRGQRTSDDALPIHMQFKFGRAPEQYQIDEQLLREGVLRFKLKVRKWFKFRTLAKSNNVPLRAVLDQSEAGGVAIDPLQQDVKLSDGKNAKAQLRIVLHLGPRN